MNKVFFILDIIAFILSLYLVKDQKLDKDLEANEDKTYLVLPLIASIMFYFSLAFSNILTGILFLIFSFYTLIYYILKPESILSLFREKSLRFILILSFLGSIFGALVFYFGGNLSSLSPVILTLIFSLAVFITLYFHGLVLALISYLLRKKGYSLFWIFIIASLDYIGLLLSLILRPRNVSNKS